MTRNLGGFFQSHLKACHNLVTFYTSKRYMDLPGSLRGQGYLVMRIGDINHMVTMRSFSENLLYSLK